MSVGKPAYVNDGTSVTSHPNDSNAKGGYFVCQQCGGRVSLEAPGTKNRNHCPFCLISVHVDAEPGDRKSGCEGLMEPLGKMFKPDGEEVLVHKCTKCGFVRKNRIAGDDDWGKVAGLTVLQNLPV